MKLRWLSLFSQFKKVHSAAVDDESEIMARAVITVIKNHGSGTRAKNTEDIAEPVNFIPLFR